MRRLALSLLVLLLLAACSSAPQRISRGSGSQSVANGAYHTPPPGFPNFVDHSIGREEISIQAMSLVGIPYRWGGNTPDSGFDCSGLVRYVVARAASVNLPRTTADMSERGDSIDPDEVAAGDLIFFNTTGRPHSHVGIYVGKLRFVNAPSTGGTVRIDYLTNPYWAKRFDGIRRVAAPTHAPAPFDAPTYQASTPPVPVAAPPTGQAPYGGGVAAGAGTADPAVTTAYGSAAPPGVSAQRTAQPAYAATAPAGMAIQPVQSSQRVATLPQTPQTASVQPASATPATHAAPADAFEPPPPAMSAAQMQAREAGAVAPPSVPAERAAAASNPSVMPAATASVPGGANMPANVAHAPDPIDAAADAFEPPPLAPMAARQEQQSGSYGGGVQVMRASTASHGTPAPTQSSDDPIAHFANGSY